MKKYCFLTILLGLLFTACSNDASSTQDEAAQGGLAGFGEIALSYNPVVVSSQPPNQVRAFGETPKGGALAAGEPLQGKGELTTELLRNCGFGVYCWYTGSADFTADFTLPAMASEHIKDHIGPNGFVLMQNQQVNWNSTSQLWEYAPAKYWPLVDGEKLTLRAYAPYRSYLYTDVHGLPHVPVVVQADDFCNNHQQDPVWGTSRHQPSGVDDGEEAATYGELYNNYNLTMSGDKKLQADSRDGVIDWFFHHGMAKIELQAQLQEKEPGASSHITKVVIGPLYNQGLLDIFSSKTENNAQKPLWTERSPGIGTDEDIFSVELGYNHNGTHNDLAYIELDDQAYQRILENGLLIIPRNYTAEHPLHITITYEETNGATTIEKVLDGTIAINLQGNTVYSLQALLDVEDDALYISSFINLYWQTGAHDEVSL